MSEVAKLGTKRITLKRINDAVKRADGNKIMLCGMYSKGQDRCAIGYILDLMGEPLPEYKEEFLGGDNRKPIDWLIKNGRYESTAAAKEMLTSIQFENDTGGVPKRLCSIIVGHNVRHKQTLPKPRGCE